VVAQEEALAGVQHAESQARASKGTQAEVEGALSQQLRIRELRNWGIREFRNLGMKFQNSQFAIPKFLNPNRLRPGGPNVSSIGRGGAKR
jgi:hypothetical protein